MQWLWIVSGLLLLLSAWVVNRFIQLHRNHGHVTSYRHLHVPFCLLHRLKRTAGLPPVSSEIKASQNFAKALAAAVIRLRRDLRRTPALPCGDNGEPRILPLANQLSDDSACSTSALLAAISAWPQPLLPSEVAALPLCIAVTQCRRLGFVLHAIRSDAKERSRADRLYRRLKRRKSPAQILEKARLRPVGLAALLAACSHPDDPLHQAFTLWLEAHDLSAETITTHALERQMQLIHELQRAMDCFSALGRLDWLTYCEEADPLHPLLLEDPSGTYPRLDSLSRYQLRQQAEQLARHTCIQAADVVGQAFSLCANAAASAPESCLSYWFQEPRGLSMLHRTLRTRKGWLYAHISLRRSALTYIGLWCFSILCGFVFLHSRQPVFMLPFFLWVIGCVSRFFLRLLPPQPLARMTLPALDDRLRILVVLPVQLSDEHTAIRMVRQLKTAMHAFPEEVHFLLIGDFAPSITPVSSNDPQIILAADAAVRALNNSHVFYIQRSRIWNDDAHAYCARGGHSGAVLDVCRLIAQGECEDPLAYSTLEVAQLERKYAYILPLTAHCQPAPGMLEALMGVMLHPLYARQPLPDGWRGYSVVSPEGSMLFDGAGMIRPDVYLEALDGVIDPQATDDALAGELACHLSVPGARMYSPMPLRGWASVYQDTYKAWKLLRWQLSHVHTPAGLVRNPLSQSGRFRLRELMRATLVPLGRCALLLWAILTNQWPLLLLALFAPEIGSPLHHWTDLMGMLCRISLLPSAMTVSLRAIFDAVFRRTRLPDFSALEIWSQGIAATILAALGIALPGGSVPALLLAAAFAAFPLTKRIPDAPLRPHDGLTDSNITLLDQAASSTWAYFKQFLPEMPPNAVQFDPDTGPDDTITPESLAAALIACICARELGYLSSNDAALHISHVHRILQQLPQPCGLPCKRYTAASLVVLNGSVDARACGVLLAALLTAAQALRTWLPELSPDYLHLSGALTDVIHSFDLSRLYDSTADLFFAALDADGQPVDYIDVFTDDAILLSLSACAMGVVPPRHFRRLQQPCIRYHGQLLPLSRYGSATAHLLGLLFFPAQDDKALVFIQAMSRSGFKGMFGQGESACSSFDAALHYQHRIFGLNEAALSVPASEAVYTPYAAALCLPHQPHMATEALQAFHAAGALGPLGFCEAVDCTGGINLIKSHNTFHQGLILAGATHILADAPLQRYFCAIPEVEATLPLLRDCPTLTLPRFAFRHPPEFTRAPMTFFPEQMLLPGLAHVIGTPDFHMIINAANASLMFDGELPLVGATGFGIHGPQFFLIDEGRTYRLGNPLLPGKASFAPGGISFEQVCGSLKAELHCTVDTLRKRALHIITITNLSTRDRIIALADVLHPGLMAMQDCMTTESASPNHLMLHIRNSGLTLYHTLSTSAPPLDTTVCTDAAAFYEHPTDLPDLPPQITYRSSSSLKDPIASFRTRIALSGRSQVVLWFTTSTQDSPPPQLWELSSIRHIAMMQHTAIDQAAGISLAQLEMAQQLLIPLLRFDGHMDYHLSESAIAATTEDLLTVCGWYCLHGLKLQLNIMYPAESGNELTQLVNGSLAEAHIHLHDEQTWRSTTSALQLTSDLPLSEQLIHLHRLLLAPQESTRQPQPGVLKPAVLRFSCQYGGFEPDGSAYLVQLQPGEALPAPWENQHGNSFYSETVDINGIHAPFHEQIYVDTEDGVRHSPWSDTLPRTIRFGAGESTWESSSDRLSLRLTAACIPGQRCGVRLLKIRNLTSAPQHLRIWTLLPTGNSLSCAPGMAMTTTPGQKDQAFIAGDGWDSRRTNAADIAALCGQLILDLPDDEHGTTAVLHRSLTLAPQGSEQISWLTGYTRHAEDVTRMLTRLARQQPSGLLREVRTHWAERLTTLRISTPEESFNLFTNHILPVQALSAPDDTGIPALLWLSPQEAKRRLLRAAKHASCRGDWLRICLLLNAYISVHGDDALASVYLSAHGNTLIGCCQEAILALPLDAQGLPADDDPAQNALLYALAAQCLHRIAPSETLTEFIRNLLNAVDTHLWQDGYYGNPLHLHVQTLAWLAYGDTLRTRSALSACWKTLYDQRSGMIITHHADPDDPIRPGLPQNGGMLTTHAALYLHALLQAGMTDAAFELLRALNPLHHTDDPLRMESFRCAPFRLHGGMSAAPMPEGRGIPDGGNEAASILYAVLLHDVIGLRRQKQRITMHPCVPPEWEEFTVTLQEGASTWHLHADRRITQVTVDGIGSEDDGFTILDDGDIHDVRIPLK